jgi:two-component system cell cycle response regulator DivK
VARVTEIKRVKLETGLLVAGEIMQTAILLVEDSAEEAYIVRTELEVLGYSVSVVSNGLAAVEAAAENLPDLIIVVVRLPFMNGLQATSEIKKNPSTKRIPVLVATANAMPGDREKCLAAGCDGYIATPFTHMQLGMAIEGLLAQPSK